MHQGQFIFTQLCSYLPKRVFDCLVEKYQGNKYVKSFTCWNHLRVLIFGQLTNRESLRDLIITLNAHTEKFHHLGFGKSITRSNLSKANETRSVEIFELFAQKMLAITHQKKAQVSDFFMENDLYALDSSTITFCLKKFWWSSNHCGKGGIKLHTLYDIKHQLPTLTIITDQLVSDSTAMDWISYIPNSFYVFDKAYVSTSQLYYIDTINAFFVVRKKNKMAYKVVEDKHYNDKGTGVMADQLIQFTGKFSKKGYPAIFRSLPIIVKKRR